MEWASRCTSGTRLSRGPCRSGCQCRARPQCRLYQCSSYRVGSTWEVLRRARCSSSSRSRARHLQEDSSPRPRRASRVRPRGRLRARSPHQATGSRTQPRLGRVRDQWPRDGQPREMGRLARRRQPPAGSPFRSHLAMELVRESSCRSEMGESTMCFTVEYDFRIAERSTSESEVVGSNWPGPLPECCSPERDRQGCAFRRKRSASQRSWWGTCATMASSRNRSWISCSCSTSRRSSCGAWCLWMSPEEQYGLRTQRFKVCLSEECYWIWAPWPRTKAQRTAQSSRGPELGMPSLCARGVGRSHVQAEEPVHGGGEEAGQCLQRGEEELPVGEPRRKVGPEPGQIWRLEDRHRATTRSTSSAAGIGIRGPNRAGPPSRGGVSQEAVRRAGRLQSVRIRTCGPRMARRSWPAGWRDRGGTEADG